MAGIGETYSSRDNKVVTGTLSRVVIVGRPNVGKSTLFNRIVGRKEALVTPTKGVTRDSIERVVEVDDVRFVVVDTGGLDEEIYLSEQVKKMAFKQLEHCDLALFVVAGDEGILPSEKELFYKLRKNGIKTLVVVNKADKREARENFTSFYEFGSDLVFVSAEHGEGIDTLLDEILTRIENKTIEEDESILGTVTLVGRPNVGKSSILNSILGDERSIVTDSPGTTRDPVDVIVETDYGKVKFVDVAGIRRDARVKSKEESLSILFAKRRIEASDVVLLVIDSTVGITHYDLSIAQMIMDAGKASIVVVNKWDIGKKRYREILERWGKIAKILGNPPRINVSALTGKNISKIEPLMLSQLQRFRQHFSTYHLNKLIKRYLSTAQVPVISGAPFKVYYVTQVNTAPPTFMLFANRSLDINSQFRKYLANRLREDLKLNGIPVRLVVKVR